MSMPRGARMNKKQKQLLISYLENNKEMLRFKHPISELPTIKKKWEEMALMLNNEPGANKTVKQWKEALNELKTNVRRKSRALVYENTGTGGGPKKLKELDELEERLLALLSKIVIVGAPNVVEAGLQVEINNDVPSAALDNNYYALDDKMDADFEPILIEYVPSTSQQISEEHFNAESETFTVQETDNISQVKQKKGLDTSFIKSSKKKSRKAEPLNDLTNLHVECLKDLAQSNNNMAAAISQLAKQFSKRNCYRSPVNNLRF